MPLIVVPWRGGCPHRDRAWAWVRAKLEAAGYIVVVAEAPPGPWIKAAASMPAIRQSRSEVVVVHDADVWAPGLSEAVEAVAGGAGWGIPHRGVFRLTESATDALLDGAEDFTALELDQPAYLGLEGGGITVLRREVALDCPMPAVEGWGSEDIAWGIALRELHGPPVRARKPLVHLWHPPQERLTRKWGSLEGRQMVRRFHRARGNPDEMRRLIEEFDVSGRDGSAQSGRGDREPLGVG